ncbi:MAG TPA: DUF1634 domain-containing protein [Terriglobales bacterium]|nr:DUF1634 domain-containing protein [Terriglobales bacterium]
MAQQLQPTAANVYSIVFRVLFWGMVVSTSLFALGVFRALQHPVAIPLAPIPLLSFHATLHGLARLDPASLMLTATLLLILTPVVRVVLACIAFAVDRDPKFVAVTGIVLAVIVLTVVLGRLGLR